jgi:putative ABC transport system permease protein
MKDIEQRKEECRDMRGTSWLESTLQDLRYAIRTLRKASVFSLTVIATLALVRQETATVATGLLCCAKPIPPHDSTIT